jgi:hypothetical protein
MKNKKASTLLITLTVIVAVGFLSSIGFLMFGSSSSEDLEDDLSLQEQLALQNALLEQEQTQNDQATSTPSASFSFSSSSDDDDDDAPGEIEDLIVKEKDTTWIFWDWTNPDDDDFDKNLVYIDGVKVTTTSSSYYNATGLTPGVSYTIEVKTRDYDGNVNEDGVTDTSTTLSSGTNDTITFPTMISNLLMVSRNTNSVHWSWLNPTSPLFTHNIILLNGVNVLNTSNNYYTATGLNENTQYTISITTNLNSTAVTSTTTTCYVVEWFESYVVCP